MLKIANILYLYKNIYLGGQEGKARTNQKEGMICFVLLKNLKAFKSEARK